MGNTVQNHYGSGDNVKVKHEHHNYETPYVIPKVLTPHVGLASWINFVGRKDELKKVEEFLNQDSALLLINGIGGIGKSTLASYYFKQNKETFDYYGFIQVGEDIKSSFISALSTSLSLQKEKIDDLFNEAMNKLHNLRGKKLLVLDDIKDIANQKDEIDTIMTLKNSGFTLLFTSREDILKIAEKNKYFLNVMSKEEAIDLFVEHYPTDEIDKVNIVIDKYLDYHTLFIEMTAKTLFLKKRLSLDQIIEKFEKEEFSIVKRDDIQSYQKFLDNFSLNDIVLNNNKILLALKQLALLPSIEISFDDLYTFLDYNDRDNLDETLIQLIRNGWLIEFESGYKLHQILKEYILEKYTPSLDEVINVVNQFRKLISDSGDHKKAIENERYIIYLEPLLAYILKHSIFSTEIVYFTVQYSNILFSLGSYQKSFKIRKKSLEISEEIQDIICTAISYDAIANSYYIKEDFVEALSYHELAYDIYRNIPNIKESNPYVYHSMATNLNNYATCYEKTNKLDKALSIYEYTLLLVGQNHGSLHGLAIIYCRKEEFKKGFLYFQRALNLINDWHPERAVVYNNMSYYYANQEKFTHALKYIEKAIQIREKIYSNGHPELELSYKDKKYILDVLKYKAPIKSSKKPKRNEVCPCGSKEKYKQCCGK